MSLADILGIASPAISTIAVGRICRPEMPLVDHPRGAQDHALPVLRDVRRDRTVIRRGVIVRDVGGVLPSWVEPTSEDESACILDIVILTDPEPITAPDARHLRTVSCMWRVVTGAPQILASDAVWPHLPRTDVAVSAAAPDLDTVARCFADLVVGGGMIGVDSADVFDVLGCQGSQVLHGRAVIIQGQGRKAGLAAQHELTLMQRERAISAVFLCQLVSTSDIVAFALNDVDEMATAAMAECDQDLVLTCYLDRPRTEVVAIAFDR